MGRFELLRNTIIRVCNSKRKNILEAEAITQSRDAIENFFTYTSTADPYLNMMILIINRSDLNDKRKLEIFDELNYPSLRALFRKAEEIENGPSAAGIDIVPAGSPPFLAVEIDDKLWCHNV